nr:hypothetical protein [Candidatus Woesearchaeota archaeon]
MTRGKHHEKRTTLPKFVEKSTEGKCKYCNKHVKNLEAHIRSRHKDKLK